VRRKRCVRQVLQMSLCLVVLFFVMVMGTACTKAEQQTFGTNGDGFYSVIGVPTITVSKIDSILCNAGSPACGTGKSLYDLGVQYTINPVYALAWFRQESTYGTAGVARSTHALGNIQCSHGYACYQGFRSYSGWVVGYEDWYKLIAGPVYVGSGLTTVNAIAQKYAPSGSNNTIQYVRSIESFVDSCSA